MYVSREEADSTDFEFARDRIMMGIERKKLSMSEKDRLNTAIHEAGHALVAYFNPNAMKLYKATVVARGGALGAVSCQLFILSHIPVVRHTFITLLSHIGFSKM